MVASPPVGRPRVSSIRIRGAVSGSGAPSGRPRQGAQGRGWGAAEEQEGETGCRGAAGDERQEQDGPAPQHPPHQDAAETVLISMVCRPLTRRCVPVTLTLLSA